MADAKVNIVGNSEDAQRAVDKLRASFEKLEEKLRNQAKFSKQAKTSGDEYLRSQLQAAQSLVMGIFSLQTAWGAATSAAKTYFDTNKQIQDARGAVAQNARETEIKVINQGMLNKAEAATTMANVDVQAMATPVGDIVDARRITEEAFSQGFERQQVINGEILKAFLELKVATNQYGAGATDSKELVKSLATSLRNTEGRDPGKAMTVQDIEEFGRAFQALTLTGSIQLADAIPFARIQAILTARGIDNETQLAAFSEAVDAFGSGDVAATYLQQATAYMGRAGSEKMQQKLDKLGIEIDGTQFDLIGEDFVDALRNMNAALEGMNPREKADAIDALFGTKAAAGAITLMSKADNIEKGRQKIAAATEGDAYLQTIETYQASAHARSQKIAAKAEIASVGGLKSQGELTQQDVDNILKSTYEAIKADSTASMLGFTLNKMVVDMKQSTISSGQTPSEYLQDLSNWAGVGDAENKRSQAILQKEIDDAYKVKEEAAAGAAPFPEKMEVNDPNLQASVNKLDETMNNVLAVLSSGPDRQRVIKTPARTSGTV